MPAVSVGYWFIHSLFISVGLLHLVCQFSHFPPSYLLYWLEDIYFWASESSAALSVNSAKHCQLQYQVPVKCAYCRLAESTKILVRCDIIRIIIRKVCFSIVTRCWLCAFCCYVSLMCDLFDCLGFCVVHPHNQLLCRDAFISTYFSKSVDVFVIWMTSEYLDVFNVIAMCIYIIYYILHVDFRSLGSVDRLNTLMSLAKSRPVPTDRCCYFTDQRIVANGFAIREYKGKVYVYCY